MVFANSDYTMGLAYGFIMEKLEIKSSCSFAALGPLAKKAHVGRVSLYKTLSEAGNPKWHTLVSLCVAMGLNLRLS